MDSRIDGKIKCGQVTVKISGEFGMEFWKAKPQGTFDLDLLFKLPIDAVLTHGKSVRL